MERTSRSARFYLRTCSNVTIAADSPLATRLRAGIRNLASTWFLARGQTIANTQAGRTICGNGSFIGRRQDWPALVEESSGRDTRSKQPHSSALIQQAGIIRLGRHGQSCSRDRQACRRASYCIEIIEGLHRPPGKQTSSEKRPVLAGRILRSLVRDGAEFIKIRRYIEENPVKAGLAKIAEDWPWSSAFSGADLQVRSPFD